MAESSPNDTLEALDAFEAIGQERIFHAADIAEAFSTSARP